MSSKFDAFKAALIALCDEHGIVLWIDGEQICAGDRGKFGGSLDDTAFWQRMALIDHTDPDV